jgi:hypothetical protein
MMGVELIHTLQIIYFVSSISPIKNELTLAFTGLSNLNFNIRYSSNDYNNYYCTNCQDYFSQESFYLSRVYLLSIISLPTLCRILHSFKTAIKYQRFNTLNKKIYNFILFPFAIGFLYEGSLPAALPSSDFSLSIISILLIFITSFVFFQ